MLFFFGSSRHIYVMFMIMTALLQQIAYRFVYQINSHEDFFFSVRCGSHHTSYHSHHSSVLKDSVYIFKEMCTHTMDSFSLHVQCCCLLLIIIRRLGMSLVVSMSRFSCCCCVFFLSSSLVFCAWHFSPGNSNLIRRI